VVAVAGAAAAPIAIIVAVKIGRIRMTHLVVAGNVVSQCCTAISTICGADLPKTRSLKIVPISSESATVHRFAPPDSSKEAAKD
jgi:hypothetical protein